MMTTDQDIAVASQRYEDAVEVADELLKTLNALIEKKKLEDLAKANTPAFKVQLVNEVGKTDQEMQIYAGASDIHGNRVATAYESASVEVSWENFDNKIPTIYLTERLPIGLVLQSGQKRAQAYRVIENGIPTAYVSARMSGRPFGRYRKPWILKGIVKSPALIAPGTISAVAHELSEMIVAPLLDQFTMPDSAGKSWRKEACDPVLGSYYAENVSGVDCVLPDFVLPSFWDANGQAPYSYLGTAKAPMVWAKGSYAWFKSAVVRLLRVQF